MEFPTAKCTHFGGVWGRLVECTKKTWKSVLQNRIVAKEALRTALVESEGILDSRPITRLKRCG